MAITKFGDPLKGYKINIDLMRDNVGTFTFGSLAFQNRTYLGEKGFIEQSSTTLTTDEIPLDLQAEFDSVMSRIYELEVHKQKLGADV